MTISKNIWTRKAREQSAAKYKTCFDCKICERKAYDVVERNGWLDECCAQTNVKNEGES